MPAIIRRAVILPAQVLDVVARAALRLPSGYRRFPSVRPTNARRAPLAAGGSLASAELRAEAARSSFQNNRRQSMSGKQRQRRGKGRILASEFQRFQAMQSASSVADVRDMPRIRIEATADDLII